MTYGGRLISNGPSQDNTVITHAVDTIAGTDYHGVKLIDATENSTTPIGNAANPMHVQGTVTATVSTVLPTTATHSRPTINSGASTLALAENVSRKAAVIQNNTSAVFYLKEGAVAVTSQGFPLFPNQYYKVLTTAAINAIQSSGGGLELDVLEGT